MTMMAIRGAAVLAIMGVLIGCGDDAGGGGGSGGSGGSGTTDSSTSAEASTSAETSTSTQSTTDTATSGSPASTSSGGDVCDPAAFADEGEPTPLAITIRNDTDGPIYIGDECEASGLDGVSVGGASLDSWLNPTACSTWIEDPCAETGPDCFGSPPVTIQAGASITVTWNGYFFEDEELLPDACTAACTEEVLFGCHKRFAPPAGPTTIDVEYYLDYGDEEEGPIGDASHAELTVDLPAEAATVVIGP